MTCIGSIALAIEAAMLHRFIDFCKNLGAGLPAPTQFVIDTSFPFAALGVVGLLGVTAWLLRRYGADAEASVTLLIDALGSCLSAAFCLWACALVFIALA